MTFRDIRFASPGGRYFRSLFAKLLFVLIFWTGGLYSLFVLFAWNASVGEIPAVPLPAESVNPNSAFGPIRYTQWDPQQDHRLRFSVSLDDLTVKPGALGLFKTGLFKIIQVRSLQVRKYEYESDPGLPSIGMDSEATAQRSMGLDNLGLAKGFMGTGDEPLRLANGMEIRIDRPDVSDAGQLLVENFDYQIFLEGRPRLSIRSKRAFASWEESGILLRGGVMITAADGPKVRSNRIRWDTRNHVFSVEDNYLLTQGPSQTAGNKIYLDEQLHIIDAAQAVSSKRTTEGPNYARR
jgi:hypothetical protein